MRRALVLGILLVTTATPPGVSAATGDITAPAATLSASRATISPNDDGRFEQAELAFASDEPVWIDAHVFNSGGTAVRLLADETALRDQVTYRWDGRRDDGVRLPDGAYHVRVIATDQAGNATTLKASLTLDTKAPALSWRVAGGVSGAGALRASFTTLDSSGPVAAEWSLLDSYGVVIRHWERRLAVGDGALFVPKAAVLAAGPGLYRLESQLEDSSGNRALVRSPLYKVSYPTANRLVGRVEGAGRRVALTFDDCNTSVSWDSILTTLSRHQVKATFFCPGLRVQSFPTQAQRTLEAGHTVGSHGWDHTKFTTLSYASALWRLRADRDVWWRWQAAGTPYFRPPYGAFDATAQSAAGQAGYRWTVLWDLDPRDWTDPGPAAIASRVLSKARPGSIILLHVKPQTAKALPLIIKGLRSRGLEPTGLDQLLRQPGVRANPLGW